MDYQDLTTLGIALGLGMLVGLQRQHTNSEIAGVRTFTLISLLGALCGFLSRDLQNPYIFPVIAISLTAFLIVGNISKIHKLEESDAGQTTEVAAILMFVISGYLVFGDKITAIVVSGAVTLLLYFKKFLHDFISDLKAKDISAVMTFVGMSLVILPILPDKTFGPYDVLNPRNIWLMVTLIIGISVAGYFLYKFLGKNAGLISNGILGGLISSTATTVSYAKKASEIQNIGKMAAFVIVTASTVALARVIVEIGVVVPELLPKIIIPLALQFVIMVGICVGIFLLIKTDNSGEDNEMPEPENPAQLKSALIFGFLYGVILLAVAFTKKQFGNEGLYIVSIISGLTDVDAITLSLSDTMKHGSLPTTSGWKLILLASLSNLVFKGGMAVFMGDKQLKKWIIISFGIALIAGLLIIWLWPANWHF